MKFVKQLPDSIRFRRSDVWVEEATRLRARPGEWAYLGERISEAAAAMLASGIRHGTLKAFRDGEYEARSTGTAVYARYVG
jgi:hypothetical protein